MESQTVVEVKKVETKEWHAPDFDEITLNCEVASYAPADFDGDYENT